MTEFFKQAARPLWFACVLIAAGVVAWIVILKQAPLAQQLGNPILVGLEALALVFFAILLFFAIAPPPTTSPVEFGMRRKVFLLNALLLTVLLAIALLRYRFPVDEGVAWLKAELHGIWFAMLGSVAISFKGVYDHTKPAQWDEGWWLWYLGRPLTGAIVGTMTYLLLQVVNPNQPPSITVLAVAAFVLGTQESRFFGFLYEVGKLVLTTPDSAQVGLRVTSLTPHEGKQNDAVLITGTGFQAGVTATLGTDKLGSQQVAPDGTAISGLAPAGSAGQVVDLVVANPSGVAYRIANAFTFK